MSTKFVTFIPMQRVPQIDTFCILGKYLLNDIPSRVRVTYANASDNQENVRWFTVTLLNAYREIYNKQSKVLATLLELLAR